jgi:hypothetical protein
MAQIQKGFTYTATSPNNLVTYVNLNEHVDNAALLPGAINDQTTKATPAAGDALLVHSAADSALRKSTVAQLLNSNQAASFASIISTAAIPVTSGGTGIVSTPSNGELLIGNGTGYTKSTLTAGANVTITNGVGGITIAAASGGGGSVTSINASGGSTGLSFSGGPVTSAGTLTLAGTLAIANGGTGATSESAARTALGLGNAATSNITVSTSNPSGGSDGDIWLKY